MTAQLIGRDDMQMYERLRPQARLLRTRRTRKREAAFVSACKYEYWYKTSYLCGYVGFAK